MSSGIRRRVVLLIGLDDEGRRDYVDLRERKGKEASHNNRHGVSLQWGNKNQHRSAEINEPIKK
jgi:pyridoxine/pyridoxamine 5'-phosphate oxidase